MKKITQTIALDNVQWVTYVLSLPWSDVEPFDAALARFFFFFFYQNMVREKKVVHRATCLPLMLLPRFCDFDLIWDTREIHISFNTRKANKNSLVRLTLWILCPYWGIFSLRKEPVLLLFLVNRSFTSYIRINLLNIFRTARHAEQSKEYDFSMTSPCVCSLIDQRQLPITVHRVLLSLIVIFGKIFLIKTE